ncbi:MAG: PiT family inorganic phosphate transporter [Gammaproteobacteria bacterium]|jgi:PiT family inorganic phosphate transporter
MENEVLFLALATVFGFFAAWGIGANDVANAMSTSIGSRALTLKQALLIAGIFEFAGAVLAGGEVTATIRKGIVDSSYFVAQPEILIYGMLASLLGTGSWLLIASTRGWPVSTTHSVVGAIVGFSIAAVGFESVHWPKIGVIAASWIVSPIFSAIVAYLIFSSITWLILTREDPLERARRYAPIYIFITVFLIALVTMMKGLKHVDIGQQMSPAECYGIATLCGIVIAIIGKFFVARIEIDEKADKEFHFHTVERVFAVLMVVTACSMAFAHGSNDVANAIGPVAAVISIASTGSVTQAAPIPIWVLGLGGVGIVIGLGTYGKRVIAMVGSRITPLTPSRGFSAGVAASFTIVFASGTGMPVSTTHALVGAVLGVGFARGFSAIDLSVVGRIFLSWIVTIPAGAILSIAFFFLLKAILM